VRSRAAPDGAGRCVRCALRLPACGCPLLVPLPIHTHFLVLRHVREAQKSSNTARWAALLLPRCELQPWSGRQDAARFADLGRPGDWLLFPSEAGKSDGAAPGGAPERVLVLDGTWRQAHRMLRALPALQHLPRLSVPPRPLGFRLRAPPSPVHLSTLEAMASAVALLEGEAQAKAVDNCHRALVGRALSARGRRLPEAA